MRVQGRMYIISFTMRIVKFTLLAELFALYHLSLAARFEFDRALHTNICCITCTGKFQSRMHESTGLGRGMCFVGMEWGW